MSTKYILALLTVFFLNTDAFSQKSWSFGLVTLTGNPTVFKNQEIYKMKIDKNAFFTAEPGLYAALELYGNSSTAIKFTQCVQLDAALKPSGYTQITFRKKLFKSYKHSMFLGFGPIVHYRENWNTISGYSDESIWKNGGAAQYRITWLSGEIDYSYNLAKRKNNKFLTISLQHTKPESVSICVGYKLLFAGKCGTCPSFKN